MIGLKAEGDLRQVADKLAAVPEVDYVVLCAGSFDLLVELVCEDDEDLFRLINDRVRTIPGVRATESFVYLRLVKQTYTWGARCPPPRSSLRPGPIPRTPRRRPPGGTCGCTSPACPPTGRTARSR